jgi:hypothetical protein
LLKYFIMEKNIKFFYGKEQNGFMEESKNLGKRAK